MLTIGFQDFRCNPELLFKEIINRNQEGLIEFNELGCFRVSYEPIEAANDGFLNDDDLSD